MGGRGESIHAWWVMGAWHMTLFMGIAGWFFWYSVRKRPVTELLLNKARTILPPLLFWCSVTSLLHWSTHHFRPSALSFSFALWFLWSISICILLCTLCYHTGKRIGVALEYFMAAAIGIALHFIPGWSFNAAYMFPFFYGGYIANRYGRSTHFTTRRCALQLAPACGTWAFSTYTGYGSGWSVRKSSTYLFGPQGWCYHLCTNLYRLWLGFAGSVGFAGVMHALYSRYIAVFNGANPIIRFIRELGVYSLSVYAVQSIMVEFFFHKGAGRVLRHLPEHPLHDWPLLHTRVVVPAVSLCAAVCCLWFIKRILRYPRLTALATGK